MTDGLIKHGFILIFLALVTGFVIPQAESPRLTLSAHTIGLLSGILLLAVAGIWGRMTPLASNGATGAELPEMLVGVLLISLSLAALTAAGLSIWGVSRKA